MTPRSDRIQSVKLFLLYKLLEILNLCVHNGHESFILVPLVLLTHDLIHYSSLCNFTQIVNMELFTSFTKCRGHS